MGRQDILTTPRLTLRGVIHETEIGEEGEPFDMALYAVTVEDWRDRVRR